MANTEWMATIANELGETIGQLDEAFELVKPSGHWKDAIDARVLADAATLARIERAVIHFTGSVAHLQNVGDGVTRVRAAGYWEAIGA